MVLEASRWVLLGGFAEVFEANGNLLASFLKDFLGVRGVTSLQKAAGTSGKRTRQHLFLGSL